MTHLSSIDEGTTTKLQILKPILQLNGCLSPQLDCWHFKTYQKYLKKGKYSALYSLADIPPRWYSTMSNLISSQCNTRDMIASVVME